MYVHVLHFRASSSPNPIVASLWSERLFFCPFIFSLVLFPGAQTFKIEVDSLEKANELRDVLSKAGFATFEVLASSAKKETRGEDAETRKS